MISSERKKIFILRIVGMDLIVLFQWYHLYNTIVLLENLSNQNSHSSEITGCLLIQIFRQ